MVYPRLQWYETLRSFPFHCVSDLNPSFSLFPQHKDLVSARALITFDANINCFNKYNETPFDIACRTSPALADLLLGIGGMGSRDLLIDLQLYGSVCGADDAELDGVAGVPDEAGFEPVLDPAVVSMADEKGGRGGGVGESTLFFDAVEGDKMSSIPEGW